ncbi:MAG: GTP-binding protein [Armatimonadota bacterium]|nr:MAG: GTP-binding protein [Armatimonadota bacterium]
MAETKKNKKDLMIGIFGRRKVGKTNLAASLGGKVRPPRNAAAVANAPVKLKGLGSVNLLVPPGLDDERALGVEAAEAKALLERIDLAVVVIDASLGWSDYEKFLLSKIRFSGDPVVAVVNVEPGEDPSELLGLLKRFNVPAVALDLSRPGDASPVVDLLATEVKRVREQPSLVSGLVKKGDTVWLVVPDSRPSYLDPVGPLEMRLTADAVEAGATVSVIRASELRRRWEEITERPDLVAADSSVFGQVMDLLPDDVALTTPRILLSRQRGELDLYVRGAEAISDLKPGDRVLIAEACGLHVQPDDIARVEVPNLLRKWVGGDLEFSTSGGGATLEGVEGYDLVVRCAACTLDPETSAESLKAVRESGTPITNYGVALAYMHGILSRMIEPFVRAGELAPLRAESRSIPVELHDELCLPPGM